jgi:hypothetical protein
MQDERIGVFEIATYVGLVMHAEIATGMCYPSASTIAKYLNVSERGVRRAIKVLVETGYLALERHVGKANRYFVLVSCQLEALRFPVLIAEQ